MVSNSLLHMLRRASQVGDALFWEESRDDTLTARQFAILSAIAERDGSPQSAIVEATGIDRSTLSDVMNRLEKRGLISRQRSRSDARAYKVHLTAEGQNTLESGRIAAQSVDRRLAAITGEDAAAALLQILARISAAAPQAAPRTMDCADGAPTLALGRQDAI